MSCSSANVTGSLLPSITRQSDDYERSAGRPETRRAVPAGTTRRYRAWLFGSLCPLTRKRVTVQKSGRFRMIPWTWTSGTSGSGVQGVILPSWSAIGVEMPSRWVRFQTSFLLPVGVVSVSLDSRA